MRILLTNDDGVYAPGLRAMRKELQKLGDVTVVAPAGEQSAVGHSITLRAAYRARGGGRKSGADGLRRRRPARRLRQARLA